LEGTCELLAKHPFIGRIRPELGVKSKWQELMRRGDFPSNNRQPDSTGNSAPRKKPNLGGFNGCLRGNQAEN